VVSQSVGQRIEQWPILSCLLRPQSPKNDAAVDRICPEELDARRRVKKPLRRDIGNVTGAFTDSISHKVQALGTFRPRFRMKKDVTDNSGWEFDPQPGYLMEPMGLLRRGSPTGNW
jgi:hypothetical protein